MAMSLDQAAEAFRDAMRETVKQHSLWYLIKGVLLVIVGVLAIIFPVFSSAFFVLMLGWLLIISGIVQGISLIGAGKVPHFWLELISVVLALLVGFLLVRDPVQGMHQAKTTQVIPDNDGSCDASGAVLAGYQLGVNMGVRGTPAIVLPDGRMISGYRPHDKLVSALGIEAY